MSSPDSPSNYPDVLGAITNGPRLNLDVIQLALAARPARVPAGQSFELVVLAQNAADIDVDVLLQTVLPERDRAKQKDRFVAASARLRIGLRPAEVGFATLPVTVAANTQPAPDYLAGLSSEIKLLAKVPGRIRAVVGGGSFRVEDLPAEAQNHINALRGLTFSVDPGDKKKYVQAPFAVLPPAIASLTPPRPNWISLWTMRDLADQYAVARQVAEPARTCLQQLRRENVFMPLLKANQDHFAASHYPLFPPEAIYITKALTQVLEAGISEPTPEQPRPIWPRWYVKLCRLLAQDAALATQIEPLVTRQIYHELIYDAIVRGFKIVSDVMREDFGSAQETEQYAQDLVTALEQDQPLDLARAYLPLVMSGVIANTRVTMPREQVRDTVFMLSKALEKRQPEKHDDNAFVFELTDRLIEQALDTT